MQVPQALIERRADLNNQCKAASEKSRAAAATEDRLLAELKGLEDAISMLEGAEMLPMDLLWGQRVAVTSSAVAELGQGTVSLEPPSANRAPRRDIKQLVAGYLEQRHGTFTPTRLAEELDAQKTSVVKALDKLYGEKKVMLTGDEGWYWAGDRAMKDLEPSDEIEFGPTEREAAE